MLSDTSMNEVNQAMAFNVLFDFIINILLLLIAAVFHQCSEGLTIVVPVFF
jgi:hypothetical protein